MGFGGPAESPDGQANNTVFALLLHAARTALLRFGRMFRHAVETSLMTVSPTFKSVPPIE